MLDAIVELAIVAVPRFVTAPPLPDEPWLAFIVVRSTVNVPPTSLRMAEPPVLPAADAPIQPSVSVAVPALEMPPPPRLPRANSIASRVAVSVPPALTRIPPPAASVRVLENVTSDTIAVPLTINAPPSEVVTTSATRSRFRVSVIPGTTRNGQFAPSLPLTVTSPPPSMITLAPISGRLAASVTRRDRGRERDRVAAPGEPAPHSPAVAPLATLS